MKRDLAFILRVFSVAMFVALTACSDETDDDCEIPLCEGEDCEPQELDENGCPIPPDGEPIVDSIYVGKPCVTHADCGSDSPFVCTAAFLNFGSLTSIVPAAYCTLEAACESDDDCGDGAGCYRPFNGVDAGALTERGIEMGELGASRGRCMPTCSSAADCADGFECLENPFERSLRDIAVTDGNRYCAFREPLDCAEMREEAPEAGSCRLVYQLDGRFQITATPLQMGDTKGGELEYGKRGLLIVDLPKDADSIGESGPARVACFELDQFITVPGPPVTVATAVYATFDGEEGGTGELVTSPEGEARLALDECVYDRNWFMKNAEGKDRSLQSRFTPEDKIEGDGCLHGYSSTGAVFCEGGAALCSAGLLEPGSNPQADVWTQPWNDLVFGEDFKTVKLGGTETILVDGEDDPVAVCEGSPLDRSCKGEEAVEIPSRNPSRTWLSFEGTLLSNSCAQ